MDCEVHNFSPQLAWGKVLPETNQYELKVKCTKCGRMFTFYEPLDRVLTFCAMREMQRKTGFTEVRWEFR